ncbi:hypothetical protein I350_06633 [Cryptococcus amylolentus CBS 6273]|uniref:MADS-box domain-containing protein n=1 Tax=Cryptococcus amylolentus CBS 6273 TaxID=1296118 RepID=A0A1E3JGP8_9TREE|nr:hypothetical protein I350_06633 [Cryptococcus amylolentus CBS 6273]
MSKGHDDLDETISHHELTGSTPHPPTSATSASANDGSNYGQAQTQARATPRTTGREERSASGRVGGEGRPGSASGASQGSAGLDSMFQTETGLDEDDDDDEDSTSTKRRKGDKGSAFETEKDTQRRKIKIEYISDKSRRHITFSKRKAGIMKKAYELSILTGTQVLLLVACLNAPEGFGPDGEPADAGPVPATKAKNGGLAIRPHKLTPQATAAMAASAHAASGLPNDMPSSSHSHLPPQNQAQAHAQQQLDAVSALGVGQGSPSSRPKKRMPSKRRTASSVGGESKPDLSLPLPSEMPPVPPIPDIHRPPPPSSSHSQQSTPQPRMMPNPGAGAVQQSPLTTGQFHLPAEYHHHAHPGQPTGGAGAGHYYQPAPEGTFYYASSPAAPPTPSSVSGPGQGHGDGAGQDGGQGGGGGGGGQGGQGYVLQQHAHMFHNPSPQQHQQHQQHQQQQQQRERERLMGIGI